MTEIEDYNKIMSDRKLFDKFVYTSLPKAIKLLEERQKDPGLIKKIEKLLNGNIPEPFRKIGMNSFHFRHIATPNYEGQWFLSLAKEFGLKTTFGEFYDDKFTSNNSFKHSLGQINIHNGINKKGDSIVEKVNIIDLVKYDGKKIKDIKTFFSEPLIDFHRRLFSFFNLSKDVYFYDMSKWYKENGGSAYNYYKNLLLLFIVHGILFENFLLSGNDKKFTRGIVLPAIDNVVKLTGLKPLIVPIPPMDIEEDELWISYNKKIKSFLEPFKSIKNI